MSWVAHATFGKIVVVLVALVVLLQGLHLILLTRLDARQRKMEPHAQSTARRIKNLRAIPERHTANLSEMLRQLQLGVLDSSGEFQIVNAVSKGYMLPQQFDVTFATQCSLSHMHNLLPLSKRWEGPMSVAVFAIGDEVFDVLRLISGFTRCHESLRANATFHLVVPLNSGSAPRDMAEEFASCDEVQRYLASKGSSSSYSHSVAYPVNLLRNTARRGISTDFVLVSDADLLPNENLREDFIRFARKNRISPTRDKTLYVLPAFESSSEPLPANKKELVGFIESGVTRPFYFELCWKCQAHTDYTTWQQDQSAELGSLFEVLWKDPWEPFYIASNLVPFYDERFRQYGFNRISQVCELHVAGYKFSVLSTAFLVHHGWKKRDGFHSNKEMDQEQNRLLFRQFKTELKERYPESSRRCY